MNIETPSMAAEGRIALSQEYSELSNKVAILESHRASYFNTERAKFESDKATDRAWEVTEEGIAYTYGKARLKAIEKELSALNTYINVKTNEARGLY